MHRKLKEIEGKPRKGCIRSEMIWGRLAHEGNGRNMIEERIKQEEYLKQGRNRGTLRNESYEAQVAGSDKIHSKKFWREILTRITYSTPQKLRRYQIIISERPIFIGKFKGA